MCLSSAELVKIVKVEYAADKIRRLCARLLNESPDSEQAAVYRAELRVATGKLMAEQEAWNRTSEPDVHQDGARQSYRSRESDSADGFAEGLKLFKPNRPDSTKKKD
jgi:hypothetical protein